MFDMIKEALKSKKFWAMIAAVLGLVAAGLSGVMPWVEVANKSLVAVMVYVGAQGLADVGKSKAKIEATGKQ